MPAFFAKTVSLSSTPVEVVEPADVDRTVVVRSTSNMYVGYLDSQDPADYFVLPTGAAAPLILPAGESLWAYGGDLHLFVGGCH